MLSFDNGFDSIHRSDKRAKQVELQLRPISHFKESFGREEKYIQHKNKNTLPLFCFQFQLSIQLLECAIPPPTAALPLQKIQMVISQK